MICVPYIITRCSPDKTVPVHLRFTLSRPQSYVIWKPAGSTPVREERAGEDEIGQPGCKSVYHAASKVVDATTTAYSSQLICGFSLFTILVFDFYSSDLNGLMYFLSINFWHEHAGRFFCFFFSAKFKLRKIVQQLQLLLWWFFDVLNAFNFNNLTSKKGKDKRWFISTLTISSE